MIGSASGNGKTTLGKELARRLDVPFVELDALVHGPNWVETPDDELRAAIEPVLAADGWVIDGAYRGKLGDLVLRSADVVVWLDLPIRVWLPRLLRRTVRRIRGGGALEREHRVRQVGVLGPRVALRVRAALTFPPAPGLSRGAGGLGRRAAAHACGGGALPSRRL